jgi:hypothetical protein
MIKPDDILDEKETFYFLKGAKHMRVKIAMEEFAKRRPEEAKDGHVDTIVSVQDLKSLSGMIREQPKVDKLLGDNGALAKQRELVYNECADFVERLANGDKSVIEKL